MKIYLRLLLKIFFVFLVLLALASVITFFAYKAGPTIGDYTVTIVANLIVIIYLGYILKQTFGLKEKDDSLYEWLDRLDGGQTMLSKILQDTSVQKDVLENLTNAYNKILVYSKHRKIDLKLLKAYYKALNTENSLDLFAKTFIAFVFGLFATNINNGNLIALINNFSNREVTINSSIQNYIDILTLFIIFVLVMSFIIRDFYSNRKRLILIQELLEVAIQEK